MKFRKSNAPCLYNFANFATFGVPIATKKGLQKCILLLKQVVSSIKLSEVLAHGKYDTVIVYKKKRRTRYERRNGHRQGYTEVLVTELRSGAESAKVDSKVIERNRARVGGIIHGS